MKTFEATEQAYKNGCVDGYRKGYAEGHEDGVLQAKKRKLWLMRFLCWLTGGHDFRDIDVLSRHDKFGTKYLLRMKCRKCGLEEHTEIPRKWLWPKEQLSNTGGEGEENG